MYSWTSVMQRAVGFLAASRKGVKWTILLAGVLLLALGMAGCTAMTPTAAPPTATLQPAAAPTEAPAPTDASTATPLPTPPPDTTTLAERFVQALGITIQPDAGAWEGVQVLALEPPPEWPPLWVAYTYGFRTFDPLRDHAVGLFTWQDGDWTELGRIELSCPDYVNQNSVRQVFLEPTTIWLTVEGGTGAHSGCFDLLRWDGASFHTVISNFNSSPEAGRIQDVDGDGRSEVLLNLTEPYVFCYACGVRLYAVRLLRWDGETLAEVTPQRLLGDVDPALRRLNDQAVAWAEANLLLDAAAAIADARNLAPDNETVYWNEQWIRLHLNGRLDAAQAYPLLGQIFYGDWAGAVSVMRAYTPAEIFSLPSPLIQGTPAEGWEDVLGDWIVTFAEDALAAKPDLAPAYFLRGWAVFLAAPEDPQVLADVAQAASLAPDDPLYAASLAWLRDRGPLPTPTPTATPSSPAPGAGVPAPDTVEPLHFLQGATVHVFSADLRDGVVRGLTLGIAGGQSLYVTAPAGVDVFVTDPAGTPLSPHPDNGSVRFDIPATGEYMLILRGDGWPEIVLHIPPLGRGEAPPDELERVRFAPGATVAQVETSLTPGVVKGLVLRLLAGQRMFLTAPLGDVSFHVLDPERKRLTPITPRTTRSGAWAIPRTGDYTIVLEGNGSVQLVIDVPPPGVVNPSPPPVDETIRFAPGGVSATVHQTLGPYEFKVYGLAAAAGQRMILTTSGAPVRLVVMDAVGLVLSPDVSAPGRQEYVLPATGEYRIIVEGEGASTLTVEIP